jgi:hypothetical protein
VSSCPVCKNEVVDVRVYCSDECLAAAKKWMRSTPARLCHVCLRWKLIGSFEFSSRVCKKCRPPKKRPRRALKQKRKCLHCSKTYQPRCNAQKFCKPRCRAKHGESRDT